MELCRIEYKNGETRQIKKLAMVSRGSFTPNWNIPDS